MLDNVLDRRRLSFSLAEHLGRFGLRWLEGIAGLGVVFTFVSFGELAEQLECIFDVAFRRVDLLAGQTAILAVMTLGYGVVTHQTQCHLVVTT